VGLHDRLLVLSLPADGRAISVAAMVRLPPPVLGDVVVVVLPKVAMIFSFALSF
jgi:hypothetical protein